MKKTLLIIITSLNCLTSIFGEAPKPNILFIAVDDLRTELGCYGKSHIISPNIDALAAEGMQFNQAYCQYALCAPSRASIMTGLRPDTVEVWGKNSFDNTHQKKRMDALTTLPEYLRQNGYTTLTTGKIYHNHSDDPKDWTKKIWGGAPDYANPELLNKLIERKKKADALKPMPNWRYRQMTLGPAAECFDAPLESYDDAIKCQNAIELMRDYSKKENPFFLAVGFVKPHLPFVAPKKYWDLYDRNTIEVPSREHPKNNSPFALIDFYEMRPYADVPNKGDVNDAKTKELIHGYYACVSFIDDLVGKLVAEVEALGLKDNTLIILWSDHGWKLGEYGDWSKLTAMELDARVPLIVAGPGVQNNVQSNALVELIDLFPTVCDYAGVPLPQQLEGDSFVPLFDAPDRPWKKGALTYFDRNGKGAFKERGTYLKTDRYRYGEWRDPITHELLVQELYDHSESDLAKENLGNHPGYQKVVEKHATLLAKGWRGLRPPQ